MNHARIKALAERFTLPKYRQSQLAEAFFRQHTRDFASISTLPRDLRERLAAEPVLTIASAAVRVSQDGRAHKALLRLHDGKQIETVLLNPKPDLWSCCISSQVGCALKCSFCATGTLGFKRHLTSEEITDQVLFWRLYIAEHQLPARLTNIVYMGMGEPFHNREQVFDSLTELGNPETFGIGSRHLSVSTAGLPVGIREMADRFPQVNLALSLHAANDTLRLKLMPINKAFPLAQLHEALTYWLDQTGRKLFLEYILLAGENDQLEHAEELATWVHSLGPGSRLHVNLIAFNPTATPHHAPQAVAARDFKELLLAAGVATTIRRNLGQDIDGACGQLALKEEAKAAG